MCELGTVQILHSMHGSSWSDERVTVMVPYLTLGQATPTNPTKTIFSPPKPRQQTGSREKGKKRNPPIYMQGIIITAIFGNNEQEESKTTGS